MAKTRLRLDAELDLLNKDELGAELSKAHRWQYDAAFGVKHTELPLMSGTPAAGTLNLGADQPEGVFVGPKSGFMLSVRRIAVDGLGTGDVVKVYKDTRFIGNISAATGYATFGAGACVLKGADFLRVTGTGLTATGKISVYGEGWLVPQVFQFKVAG